MSDYGNYTVTLGEIRTDACAAPAMAVENAVQSLEKDAISLLDAVARLEERVGGILTPEKALDQKGGIDPRSGSLSPMATRLIDLDERFSRAIARISSITGRVEL